MALLTGIGALAALVSALGLGAPGGGAPAHANARARATVTPARGGSAPAATVSSGSLTLVAEPQAGVAPFLSMIGLARHSIELTMYELNDSRVEGALGAAAHRGVDVRVLLNGGYPSEHEATNDAAARELSARGVHVRFSPRYFALTHQKTLTIDDDESAVMTLNFDGEYATTRDFAVLDRRFPDIDAILATFDADWARRRIAPSPAGGDLLWSPGASAPILRMIDSAQHSLALEDEEMADASATDALCAAARRGVRVTVVMTYESDWHRALAQLKRCGAEVRVDHGQTYYIHAKVLIVDGRRALVSSQNLSIGSLEDNRELGIILTSPPLLRALSADVTADAADAAPFFL